MSLSKFLLVLPFLFSFTFNPMSQSLELGSSQKASQFLLENDTEEKMAIELTVKARSMDENGKEFLTDTSEISVFPPQVIIPPQEKRTIRVTWNGGKTLEQEKAFRVIAEQLPLKVDEKTKSRSGIQMLMKFMAAFYVTPEGAKPNIEVLSVKGDGKELKITIENSGNRHRILADPTLTVAKKDLKAKNLNGLAGENVLAKSKRTFVVPNPLVTSGEKASIKIND